jgi:lipopolysaccharide O-acetyltransferase
VESIVIGDGTLIGSKVYIGDHSHGTYSNKLSKEQLHILPSKRELGDIKPIKIGTNCWIGDNVVILAGSQIGNGCVIAANSVIKGSFPDFSTIAGIPAKKVKELSE